jgi:ATP-dependent exoDNAse (exonuclease V) beta subunit
VDERRGAEMIDLEDFSPLLEATDSEADPQERSEEYYRKQILRLQEEFQRELERVKKEAYAQGFKDGSRQAAQELQREYSQKLKEVEGEYRKRFESLKLNIDSIIQELQAELSAVKENFLKVLSDSLGQLLEYLFISRENAPFVKKKFEELLKEFEGEEVIRIEVGKTLYSFVKGEAVKLSPELGDNDFRIVFKDYSVEARVGEKLKVVRDELEREVKKAAGL